MRYLYHLTKPEYLDQILSVGIKTNHRRQLKVCWRYGACQSYVRKKIIAILESVIG